MTRNPAVCTIPCTVPARSPSIAAWAKRLIALWRAPGLGIERGRAERRVEELSDRLLADVGLARIRAGRDSRLRPV